MNNIHPTAIIGDNVELGDNNIIGAYCVIGGPYWCAGKDQCNGKVVIGDNNTIVHHVTILSPYRTQITRIGSYNEIYSDNFIGHDATLGNHILMTAGCRLAGVVTIQDHVNLGIGTKIHQRITIGKGAMLGMGAVVVRDVLPYDKVAGVPAKSLGLNEVGMERHGVTIYEVNTLRATFTEWAYNKNKNEDRH